jgi:arylsulfatase A-like enzyme
MANTAMRVKKIQFFNILMIPFLLVFLTGCPSESPEMVPRSIDYLQDMDLMGNPTAELAFKPLDVEIEDIKLGEETRKAVRFPRQGEIFVKIPMVEEGSVFTCAIGCKVETSGNPDCWFTFSRQLPSLVVTELETVWVRESIVSSWYYVEINLEEYVGLEIMLTIEPNIKSPSLLTYLANPSYLIPETTEPKRTIMICIDTLRADKVGAYGAGSILTPNLDNFAQDSVRYANCETACPWTFPSCAATATGLYPGLIGADSVTEMLREEETTIAEVFFDAGYRTASIVNNTYVSANVGMFQGYEYMSHVPQNPAGGQVDLALEWIDRYFNEDIFLYIHLFDPHVPYAPPEPFLSTYRKGYGQFETEFDMPNEVRAGEVILTDGEKEQLRGLYDGEVGYSDAELGRFFNELKSLGIYEETAIIIFADHGEEFWEHGAFEHGHAVYEEVTHVPLMMKLPGIPPGVTETRMSLIDVMPTCLAWAGLPVPDRVVGLDMFAEHDDLDTRLMFIEDCIHATERRACVQGDWKQIVYFGESREPELYNLASDPEELSNMFLTRMDLGESLVRQLLMYSAQTSVGFHARMYNFEGYGTPEKYQLVATVTGGEFSDIVHASNGVVIAEALESDLIVVQVEFGATGYISLDFNVTPEDATITFMAEYIDEPSKDFDWYLGASNESIVGTGLSVTMVDERISMSYPTARLTNSHGIYLWSIPPSLMDEIETMITPEERASLDALGYLH